MTNIKALKGHIIYTKVKDTFEVHENSYIVIDNKKVVGIFKELPDIYKDISIIDYGHNAIIIPSFIDLHIHAPQYLQMGIGLDLELIEWLQQYTYRNESLFSDVDYAKKIYPTFVDNLYNEGTLRSCIFATIHNESNKILLDELKKKKLSAYVGKVNMNQNAPNDLLQSAECSYEETKSFIDYFTEDLIKPIITPRFAPCCTSELLAKLGKLSMKQELPVQTHLAENKKEVEWVKSLFPDSKNYSDVYKKYNLYGNQKTLLAHSIYLSDEEVAMASNNDNVYLVHCPDSNGNLTSGIMPVTNYLDKGIKVGLGSDIGAGHKMSMPSTITSAVQYSKLRHVFRNEERVLSLSEAFYLATNVNGSFFGKVGSFEKDNFFDALVIRDPDPLVNYLKPIEKLQRFLYNASSNSIVERYLEGEII
ncbi:guanine deaminase [Vallitalea longa]|uniref:Guanine deaminase n=1 Tax=Vallitalea longa TaxID=2936439 RepID=A0A9W5YCD6_9FIRM|nr:amidohydrolase family protein [Vallitalea longa]GKX30020.1 guanine deaminase [Vallitalea longa]